MATPFEALGTDREAAGQIVVDFLEDTSVRYGYFKLLESFTKPDKNTLPGTEDEPKPPPLNFDTEVELGIHTVNRALSELGGLPVRFTSRDTGETSGSILGCREFDSEKGSWEFDMRLRSVQTMPKRFGIKPITTVEFEPGELKQSYRDAIATSPNKAA